MYLTARLLVLVVGPGQFFASPLLAQPAIAHFSQVEGTVTRLHRFAPAMANVGGALVEGDQIVTAAGRVEVTFADGSAMHLDHHTQVVIASAARIRLIDGRVSLRTTTAYTAETGSGVVQMLPEGIFDLTANANNRDLLVRVVEGHAQIRSPWGVESVTSAQTAFVSGPTGRPFISPWIPTEHDAFLQWGNSRYAAAVPPSASAGFETDELRSDLAVAIAGRHGGPTFLPYAHPTYRHFAYERMLRKARHDRNRGGDHNRGDVQIRDQRHRDAPERRADSAPRAQRRERPRQPQAASAQMRGAGAGAAVRQR